MRVLLVEDDRELASLVCRALKEEGDTVTVCYDGAAGLHVAVRSEFDIVVLDIMLPFMDGLEVTRRLRLGSVRTPILLLTARDAPEDIVKGLDAGADDYLTKPFDFEVLLARIRARTRIASARNAAHLRFADLYLDTEKYEATRDSHRLNLTRTEFSI